MIRRWGWVRLWNVLVILVACLIPRPAVAAHLMVNAHDSLILTSLRAQQIGSAESNGSVHFEAAVSYHLSSAPRAMLVLFVFEDNADTASVRPTNVTWTPAGSGVTTLATTYHPSPGLHTLMVVAAMLQDEQTLLAWSASPLFSLSEWPGRALFDQALRARQAGDYAAAVDDLSRAIQLAPLTGAYYCWRADSQVHRGQYDAAVADYTRALSMMPESRSCRIGRGVAYLWMHDWSHAISDLTQVITTGSRPDSWTASALRARAIAYAGRGQYDAAILDYRTYLSLVPNVSDRLQVQTWIGELQAAGG